MLDYNQPIDRARPEAPQRKPQAGFSVLELANLLWRRKVAIAAAALLGATLAVTIGKSLTPRYTATAQLYVDPRELQLVDRELTPRAQDVSGMSMVVESQARLITSNSVLLQVIEQAGLDKDPEFGGGEGASLMSSLLGLIGLQPRAPSEKKEVQLAALDALNKHITIRKTEKSFIVDIEVWSTDPAKAAMLANTLTNAYLAESRNSQASAARRATSDLSSRLKELRERLRNAETALATYKAQNNFVGTQDTLISDQQLSASNQRLAAARAATMDAQARLDQIEASRRTAADAGAIPEALQSPTIANLRAQYADARKKYAEQAGELGPRHPALRQTEKQVEDLKRTINEEIDRFAQSAKNDLTRARDFEASLNRALEAQKRQSVQLSQAAVRLRELEREADASRDVYQSFLKRSRETEEQESLNTSAARVIGEATVPQRRSFPPAMSLFAMIGFIFGAVAASSWFAAAELLFAGATAPAPTPARPQRTPAPDATRAPQRPRAAEASEASPPQQVSRAPEVAQAPPELAAPPLQPSMVEKPLIEKPLIARLQEADVIHTLGAILATGGGIDLTRLGWPTLRPGFPLTTLLNAWRDMRTAVARRADGKAMPVIALVGTGETTGRSVTALNFALAAARDGARVLMIDADHQARSLSNKLNRRGKSEPSRLGWLSIGGKDAREIKTVNGISVLPAAGGDAGKATDAIRKAIAQARAAGGYDLVILDGPAVPLSAGGRKLLDETDALVAVLPTSLDINDSLEEILTALGRAERKLVGVVLDELTPAAQTRQRGRQYA
ncbi:exopolysaccharide transport family protein [Bradyrhizobium zhanjiangense]|uniref:Polysaccharide chain length determinant N-terminal domain-containing protein n=1 Tax=Bradyrhizobium zhanjiangense TaxID=1325107 RepID=A0A4Q0QSA1_9BRAD|nr:exopolysaccharide transport family protein [Bradyrhizobium zhanjiangense]RXG98729.1 hypothetical protein EAS61_13010 [Bradyrhizobium zhanjiangense]